MSALDHLLTVATAYAAAESVEFKTVSWRVFGDSKKLEAIRDGGADIQVRRLEKAMSWFAARWPDHTPWPDDVPRPASPANYTSPRGREAA